MADESGTEQGDELTLEPAAAIIEKRRPKALWGVLAVVAVAAAALVVNAAGDDGPTAAPPLPVSLSAARAAAESGAVSADAMLAWIVYVAGEGLPALGGSGPAYRLDGAIDEAAFGRLVEALGIDGDITTQDGFWQARSSDGRYVETYADSSGSWWYTSRFGDDIAVGGGSDGSSGTTSNDTGADTGGACDADDCIDAPELKCDPDGSCEEPGWEPAPIEPPADLPSEEGARRAADDFLRSVGVDVDSGTLRIEGPYDGWYVTFEPSVDGIPVPAMTSSVTVGSRGAITSANGFLNEPVVVGDYPLIDTRAAIERLNAQVGSMGYDGVGAAREASAVDDAVGGTTGADPGTDAAPPDTASPLPPATVAEECETLEGAEICSGTGGDPGAVPGDVCSDFDVLPVEPTDGGTEGGTGGVAATEGCVLVPVPCEVTSSPGEEPVTDLACEAPEPGLPEYPEVEPTEVVLTEAELVLTMAPSTDGSSDTYLVPGYRFGNAEGHQAEVAAVSDDALAPPVTPDTIIPEPGDVPVRPSPGETPPEPGCDVAVEEDAAGTTHTMATCPPEPPPGDELVDGASLAPDQAPTIGVGYYVDLDLSCPVVVLGSSLWLPSDDAVGGWDTAAETHEGGTFTVLSDDVAQFVGDADGAKRAEFRRPGPAEDPCRPSARG